MANMPNQPTPPSSTSSNGTSPDGAQFRVVRKRNRVPLSCAPCRHRKLKCNRAHPCDNCTKRGDVQSCNYAAPGNKKRNGSSSAANASPDDMQNRIDRLEGLVLSLMTNGSQSAGAAAAQAALAGSRSNSLSTASDLRLDMEGDDMIKEEGEEEDSEVDQVSRGMGIMKVVDNGKAVFASDAHWYAILGEITEVKNYFASHKEQFMEQIKLVQASKDDESPGTAFLLRTSGAKDKAEVLASFPGKADMDRLVARYFNAYDPSVHIIHGPSFQKQYDKHWLNPNDSTVMWIGLCYAMITLSLQSYHRAGDEPPEYRGKALDLSNTFRKLTAQCLILADVTQPHSQILETMILHVQAEYGRSRDAEPGVLVLVSLCVRLAMRMGYHRDPLPHPQITPFQGEIRRRVWTFVRQSDLLFSFQFGLPSMIRTDHIDTLPPRNLYDDELYEEMTSLPPSRPTIEATPMSYMIAKAHMTFVFGQVADRTQSISNPPTYEEVMKFDQELRETRARNPPHLLMRSFQDSARDPANLIMQRYGLEMVYLRSLFVLHRRFIARGRDNPRYAYSRRTCIDASMELLAHQTTLHHESQPGGRLRSVKWYISSLTTHDFILAAMIVCLDLYHTAEAERTGRTPSNPENPMMKDLYAQDRREAMMTAIEHCVSIWESLQGLSMEAFKAAETLKVMLEKLKAHQTRQSMVRQGAVSSSSYYPQGPKFGVFPNGNVNLEPDANEDPEQSAAMTLGMLSAGGMSPGSAFGIANGGGLGMAGGAGTAMDGQAKSYPNSMAGLLNEPIPEQRTGLTPQYSGPDGSQTLAGAASPFSQLFGQNTGYTGMDGVGGDIDWVSILTRSAISSY